MTVPMAEAIRQARRAADEAREAALLVQRCRAAQRGLDLLAAQRIDLDALGGLPGDDLVDELDHEAPSPEPGGSLLDARRAWLAALITRHEALAREAEARQQALHALQAEQRQLLGRPENTDLRVRLAGRFEALRRLALERNALELEVVQLETALTTLDRIREVLREAAEFGETPDRQASLATDALASLRRILQEIDLELPLPHPASVTSASGVVEALGETRAALLHRLDPLRERRDEQRQRHEHLTRSVQGEMG